MGRNACLIGFVPFTPDIAHHLDYDDGDYDNVSPGTLVIASLFHCNTTGQSLHLAEALGMDPYDFNTHPLKNVEQVSWAELSDLATSGTEWGLDEVERFRALLRCSRTTFIYQPNA